MKKYITLLLFFFTLFSYSQNTYVPDDGFEQYLIDLGYDSGPLDDYVPTNNISTVNDLSISGSADYINGIKSLQGIEDFIALEKLTIELNEVVTIDLSSNTNLIDLYIYSDSMLQNLNISNNSKLENFHCINTSISSIDLSNNINIKDLTIGNSSITELDLSKNIKIEQLNLSHGILEKVNFKNGNNSSITQFYCIDNPNLTCFQVDNENYSKTNWIDIDDNSVFSTNCATPLLTYVPDDNFEQELINLGYDSGPLDDYVLTSNIENILELEIQEKNIADLTGIQDFKNLTKLICYTNSITSINLDNLKNLTHLNISENNLTTLNVSNNLKLVDLFCSDNFLDEINVSNNIKLERLVCSLNKIKDLDIFRNLELYLLWCEHNLLNQLNLSLNKDLKRLSCGGNLFTSIDVSNNIILEEFYAPDGNLESLDLSNNPKINYFVVSNNKLTFLDLRNGANQNIPGNSFNTTNNNLDCILVDDKNFSEVNWISIDATSTFINDESECKQTTCNITVDTLNDVITCDNYSLPSLSDGKYYTESNGNGNRLNPGDIINKSQTIFIYNEDSSNPSCSIESSFMVTINNSPDVDILNDVFAINEFTLPNLINGNYYTESGGNGNQLNSGDIITDSQTIFIYNVNPINTSCNNESSFTILIEEERDVTIPNFFTPNNDGNNDTWIVNANNNLIKEIYITDRFGKIVGKIKPNTIGWNGLYNGKPLPSTTYWYQIIFTNGEAKNGAFALIRN
ncbi:T9SS type B sorting domain-containing protein [Tenacibaculum sp. XPcli2-G]|uniref:T9SS type B sorting domain-containing protein n=1 Tax=Tenacibaculum sp. XPcli2-G TaxID=2954503 RepID=UPI0020977B3D|nr:T9SS type B sorting domain-containing protein [Tenacibaculum sp. XPcli2-G]MCO7184185.1 T9SS type B sorting domain-containing protein [Tenacibaculum sp. XPcli2-G]